MQFEILQALRALDRKTSPFFVAEAMREENLKARPAAIEVLMTMSGDRRATALLEAMLRPV
jgi:hypothetical protein